MVSLPKKLGKATEEERRQLKFSGYTSDDAETKVFFSKNIKLCSIDATLPEAFGQKQSKQRIHF